MTSLDVAEDSDSSVRGPEDMGHCSRCYGKVLLFIDYMGGPQAVTARL